MLNHIRINLCKDMQNIILGFPHPSHFYYLLLYTTLFNFVATKQPFYKFVHLPLHHTMLTFYYATIPKFYYALISATLLNFATTNHLPMILPISCHTKLHSLSTFNDTMLYTTSHNSASPSIGKHQPLYLDLLLSYLLQCTILPSGNTTLS